jgi:hypothetical protein
MSDSIFFELAPVKEVPDIGYAQDFMKKVLFGKGRIDPFSQGPAITLEQAASTLLKGRAVSFSPAGDHYNFISHFSSDEQGNYFTLSTDGRITYSASSEKDLPDFIKRCETAYLYVKPVFARADLSIRLEDRQGINKPSSYREVNWLNIYSPRLVERIGRNKLLATPYVTAKELDDGAVLLIFDTPAGGEYEKVRKYLFGNFIEKFFGRT